MKLLLKSCKKCSPSGKFDIDIKEEEQKQKKKNPRTKQTKKTKLKIFDYEDINFLAMFLFPRIE